MNERHEEMLALIKRHGRLSVKELAKQLYVSEMTIRRDLKLLEAEERIKRYNGGAMLYGNEPEFPFSERKMLHSKEKAKLAKEAAAYVEDGSLVFIDSSSTCAYIVPHLIGKSNIKIVTNSVAVLVLAAEYHIPCIMAGGICYVHDMCTVGIHAQEMLAQINPDIAFFSSLAISDDGIISDNDAEQTAVRRTVIKNAARSIFIFTDSKQNQKASYTVCRTSELYRVICE